MNFFFTAFIFITLAASVKASGNQYGRLQLQECRGNGKDCAVAAALDLSSARGVRLELPNGLSRHCERHQNNGWSAVCSDTQKNVVGNANFVSKGNCIFGSFVDETDGNVYSYYCDANGNNRIAVRNTQDFPPEADIELEGDVNVRKLASTGLRGNDRRLLDDGSVIDVLFVWTKIAECRISGSPAGCNLTDTTRSNALTKIELAIQETNTAYELSGITTRLRLVHAYRDDAFEENYNYTATLNELTNNNDGKLDSVHTRRSTFAADVVHLIEDMEAAYCGVAWYSPGGVTTTHAFSISDWSCTTGYYSFGHELGHNLGCQHDRGTSGQCSSTAYNFGYRDPNAAFRTILSYNCVAGQCDNNPGGGCTRVQRFSTSNSSNTYNGMPLGSADIDNVRTINENRVSIAQFYQNHSDCLLDTDCDDGDSTTIDVCETYSGGSYCVSTANIYLSTPPSPHPTVGLGTNPTVVPTKAPVAQLTSHPTSTPTNRFTLQPTLSHSPSNHPSKNPTNSPSSLPTVSPTDKPSNTPTSIPTIAATSIPTKAPTPLPTPICVSICDQGTQNSVCCSILGGGICTMTSGGKFKTFACVNSNGSTPTSAPPVSPPVAPTPGSCLTSGNFCSNQTPCCSGVCRGNANNGGTCK